MMVLLCANDRVLLANALKDAQKFVNVLEKLCIYCRFDVESQCLEKKGYAYEDSKER